MSQERPIILGIDPGARHIGVAVIFKDDLLYFGVKVIKSAKTPSARFSRLAGIVSNLVHEFSVSHIALETVTSRQQLRSTVKHIYQQLRLVADKTGLPLIEYDAYCVRNAICGHPKATRSEACDILARRFPELLKYRLVKRIWQREYFARLFAAVGIALISSRHLRG